MIIRFLQRHREASVSADHRPVVRDPRFVDRSYLSFDTVLLVYGNSLILFVLAIGATMVMATHGLDVSVGSIMGLAAVSGLLMNAGWSIPAIGVALLVGLVCGLINGALVSWLKVSAIVATLGTLGLYRGLVHLLSGGSWIEDLPEGFKALTKAGSLAVGVRLAGAGAAGRRPSRAALHRLRPLDVRGRRQPRRRPVDRHPSQ